MAHCTRSSARDPTSPGESTTQLVLSSIHADGVQMSDGPNGVRGTACELHHLSNDILLTGQGPMALLRLVFLVRRVSLRPLTWTWEGTSERHSERSAVLEVSIAYLGLRPTYSDTHVEDVASRASAKVREDCSV